MTEDRLEELWQVQRRFIRSFRGALIGFMAPLSWRLFVTGPQRVDAVVGFMVNNGLQILQLALYVWFAFSAQAAARALGDTRWKYVGLVPLIIAAPFLALFDIPIVSTLFAIAPLAIGLLLQRQLREAIGSHVVSTVRQMPIGLNDVTWMMPPTTVSDAEPWDEYWRAQIEHGVAGFVHIFVNDGALVDLMRTNGLRTVLCVGSGISQEPRALARAGFDVTALDVSSFAMRIAEASEPPDDVLDRLVGGRPSTGQGTLQFVTGDLRDAAVCPGPYDVVIERKTLQLFPPDEQPAAIAAVAARVASPGLFYSQTHRNGPADSWTYPVADWFKDHGWPFPPPPVLTERTGWLFSTSG